jgi:hypothetical protein
MKQRENTKENFTSFSSCIAVLCNVHVNGPGVENEMSMFELIQNGMYETTGDFEFQAYLILNNIRTTSEVFTVLILAPVVVHCCAEPAPN